VFAPHSRGAVDYGAHHEHIDDLGDAIARRLVCQLTYRAAGKEVERIHRARPLKLVWHKSALYLMACLGDHQRITTLAVHRIRGLDVMDEKFAAPRVDVDAHIEKAFGIFVSDQEEDVEVVFDAEIAWKLEERTYHPHETKERRPDGKLVYRLRSSAQWEIIPWVQSFGMFAELVTPVSWRAALKANVEAMMARYGATAG
jgi:predicted DNA-binding transcriptional regulator YafY